MYLLPTRPGPQIRHIRPAPYLNYGERFPVRSPDSDNGFRLNRATTRRNQTTTAARRCMCDGLHIHGHHSAWCSLAEEAVAAQHRRGHNTPQQYSSGAGSKNGGTNGLISDSGKGEDLPEEDMNTDDYTFDFEEERKRLLGSRVLGGAEVCFSDGCEVASLEPSSSFRNKYHVTRISGLPTGGSAASVRDFLASCGILVGASVVRMSGPDTAEIRHTDENFVQTLNQILGSDTSIRVDSLPAPAPTPTLTLTHIRNQVTGTSASRHKPWMNTVVCSWLKPSTAARLHYPDDRDSAMEASRLLADASTGTTPIRTQFIPPYTVVLAGLSTSTKEDDIGNLLASVDAPLPWTVDISDPGSASSCKARGEAVRQALAKICRMEAWEVFSEPSSPTVTAFARYSSQGVAKRVADRVDGIWIPKLGGDRVLTKVAGSIPIEMPTKIYMAVRDEMKGVKQGLAGVKIYTMTDAQQRTTRLRISCEQPRPASQAKKRIQKILAGSPATAKDGTKMLWHASFSRSDSVALFEEIGNENETVIHCDLKMRRLVIYGSSLHTGNTIAAIRKLLEELSELIVPLDLDQAMWLAEGGTERLESLLGADRVEILNSWPPALRLRGIQPDLDHAAGLLSDNPASPVGDEGDGRQDCTVCWGEFDVAKDGMIRTGCGHLYCRECFVGLCTSAADGERFPVRCVGDSNSCAHIVTLEEVCANIPSATFGNLLRRSFDSYIRKHTQAYQYCPTPDCGYIYRPTATPTSLTCQGCYGTICTSCRVSHEGYTCEESKDIRAGGEEGFKKWRRYKENVKDCPGCGAVIEKSEGCNHMKCSGCQTHICWVCLEHFDTSDLCYDHLTKKHGGC